MPDLSGDFPQSNTTTTAEGFASLPEQNEERGSPHSPKCLKRKDCNKMDVMMTSRKPVKGLWKDEKWIILNRSTFERIFDKTLLQMTADVRSSPLPTLGGDAEGAGTPPPSEARVSPHTDCGPPESASSGQACNNKYSGNGSKQHGGDRSGGSQTGPVAEPRTDSGGGGAGTVTNRSAGYALSAPGLPASALTNQETELRDTGETRDIKSGFQEKIITDMPLKDVPCLDNTPQAESKGKRGVKRNHLKETLSAIDKWENKLANQPAVAKSPLSNNEANKRTMIIDNVEQISLAKQGDLRANNNQPTDPGLKQHKENIDGTASDVPRDLNSRCSNNNGHITSSTACGAREFIAGTNKNCTEPTCINTGQPTGGKSSPQPYEAGEVSVGDGSGGQVPMCVVNEQPNPATSPHRETSDSEESAARQSRYISGGMTDCYNLATSPVRTSLDIIASVCSKREKLTMAIANNGDDKAECRSDNCLSSEGSGLQGESGSPESGSDQGRAAKGADDTSPNCPVPADRPKNRGHRNKSNKCKRGKKPKGENKPPQQRWVALSKNVVVDMFDLAFEKEDSSASVSSDYKSASRRNSQSSRHTTSASEEDCQEDLDDIDRLPRRFHAQPDPVTAETRRWHAPGKRYSQTKINNQPAAGFTPYKNTMGKLIVNDSKEDQTGTLNSGANVKGSRDRGRPDENRSASRADVKGKADDSLKVRSPAAERAGVTGCRDASFSVFSARVKTKSPLSQGADSQREEMRVEVPSACPVGQVVGRRDDCELRSLLSTSASTAMTSASRRESGGSSSSSSEFSALNTEVNEEKAKSGDCRPRGNQTQRFSGAMPTEEKSRETRGEVLDLSKRSFRKAKEKDDCEARYQEKAAADDDVARQFSRRFSGELSPRDPPSLPVSRGRSVSSASEEGDPPGPCKIQQNKPPHSKPLESPKPGWVALSKAEVHTIVDSVMNSMLGDNDTNDLEPTDAVTFDTAGSRELGEKRVSSTRHGVPRSGREQTAQDKSGDPPKVSSAPQNRRQQQHPHQYRSGEALSQSRANDLHDLASANLKPATLMTLPHASDGDKFSVGDETSPKQTTQSGDHKESDKGDGHDQTGFSLAANSSCKGGPFKWKSNMLKRVQENTCDENRSLPSKRTRDAETSESDGVKSHTHSAQNKLAGRHNKRRHHGNPTKSGSKHKTLSVHA